MARGPGEPLDVRRVFANVVLPVVCVLLVAGTFVLAPDAERGDVLLAALVAAASGFAATSIGVYGGVLVPGLLLLGVDARFAAAVSLFLQVLVIPIGAGAHVRLGNVTRYVALPLIAGGMVGAFVGPFFAGVLPEVYGARHDSSVLRLAERMARTNRVRDLL